MKEYVVGDIVAVMKGEKAVSCKVVTDGIGQTKSGSTVEFKPEDVIWKLGYNGKWPNFVHQAFKGE